MHNETAPHLGYSRLDEVESIKHRMAQLDEIFTARERARSRYRSLKHHLESFKLMLTQRTLTQGVSTDASLLQSLRTAREKSQAELEVDEALVRDRMALQANRRKL